MLHEFVTYWQNIIYYQLLPMSFAFDTILIALKIKLKYVTASNYQF